MDTPGSALAPAPAAGLPADLGDAVRRILEEGSAASTRRAYASDLRYWLAWGDLNSISVLPCSIEHAMMFIVHHVDGMPAQIDAGLVELGVKRGSGLPALSSLRRKIAAMSAVHRARGYANPFEDPRFRMLMSKAGRVALKRTGYATNRKTALVLEQLEPLLATCHGDLRGLRDRAILLFAFGSGGRRRSEVASAVCERLTGHGEEYVYQLGVTKTHQDGDAGSVPVAGRAAIALRAWLEASGINKGPIFRGVGQDGVVLDRAISDRQINRIVKARAKAAGFDPAAFGAHSLRSGFMTETGLQGISLMEAMELSTHRDVRVAARYHQAGRGLRNKAARLRD